MTKAGARIEVLLNATARRNPGGKIIGVVGIGQDITGRIAQEREYSKLIDTANAPIFGVDIDGKVNVWNQCAMRLVGYTAEEVMGYSLVQEFITDDFKVPVQTVLDQALRGEETANFEFPLITKGGARIEILLNATTRRDEQGNMIGVVGIGQDISARLAQEREYSKLIDTANAPIFGVDIDGRVNVWNQCAQRLVGYTITEVMGKNLVQVCAFCCRSLLRLALLHVFALETELTIFSCLNFHRNSSPKNTGVRSNPSSIRPCAERRRLTSNFLSSPKTEFELKFFLTPRRGETSKAM